MWPFRKAPSLAPDGRIALGNFQLTAELPNRRNISVSGYIYSDDDLAAVNARLDLYQEAIERQRTRCEIPELEAARDQRIKALDQARQVMADLEEKQKTGHLTSQDKVTLNNIRVGIPKALEEIEKGTNAIAEAKRKASTG